MPQLYPGVRSAGALFVDSDVNNASNYSSSGLPILAPPKIISILSFRVLLPLIWGYWQVRVGSSEHDPVMDENEKSTQITQLLQAAADGDHHANDELFTAVYHELRKIARAHRIRWQGNHTLNTTALIGEAYLKLAGTDGYASRTHFYATASKAMRQVLINYAEKAMAEKRGGDAVHITLTGISLDDHNTLDDILIINGLLEKLEAENPRHGELFNCRVFGGMTIQETADAIGVSPATVKRDWSLLSAWVYREAKKLRTP